MDELSPARAPYFRFTTRGKTRWAVGKLDQRATAVISAIKLRYRGLAGRFKPRQPVVPAAHHGD